MGCSYRLNVDAICREFTNFYPPASKSLGSTPESLLENAKITGYLPTGLAEMSVQDFANFVGAQPSAETAGESAYLEIISL